MSTSPASSGATQPSVMTVPVTHGMFCWFEHHSEVPERAMEYWTALVGGEHAAIPLSCGNTMHLMNCGEHHRWSLRALASCPAPLIERGPHWLPYVAVDDTDAAYARAIARGARSITAPHDNGMGRGAMLGVSRSVNTSGKMVAFEYLRVVERDGGLVYVAQPGGTTATEFVLTELTPSRAVFDNPRHDYPKRIVYELSTDGALSATIGYMKGGTPRRFEFKREEQ